MRPRRRAEYAFTFFLIGILAPLGFTVPAGASGQLEDCVEPRSADELIAGVVFGEVPYAEYRCRFRGTTAVPNLGTYPYDMPAWIIAPRDVAQGNGNIIIDPLHNNGVISTVPSGREGEQSLAMKLLGPRFLFRRGTLGGPTTFNYTTVSIRWEPRSITGQNRFDHRYAGPPNDVSPGALGDATTPTNGQFYIGAAMVADLADALRTGTLVRWSESVPSTFARVERVLAFGSSQTGRLLHRLIYFPPDGHHVPIADGWLVSGGGGDIERWASLDANGAATEPQATTIPLPPDEFNGRNNGRLIELGTEEDIGQPGARPTPLNEYLRFPNAASQRSYEVAGASHQQGSAALINGRPAAVFLPDLADPFAEQAAIAVVMPGFVLRSIDALACPDGPPFVCTNPLNWNPYARALFTALEAWVRAGTEPPPNAWLTPAAGLPTYGDGSKSRDNFLNALGGIRPPEVEAGRGTFYSSQATIAASNLAGAYVDRSARFTDHGEYVRLISRQVDRLVNARYLLPDDSVALAEEASQSLVGMPETAQKTADLTSWPSDGSTDEF